MLALIIAEQNQDTTSSRAVHTGFHSLGTATCLLTILLLASRYWIVTFLKPSLQPATYVMRLKKSM